MAEPATPDALIQSFFAFLRSGVLKTAVDLEIFTHIANGKRTSSDLAAATETDARAIRILMDALVSLGFLTKSGIEYGLTPVTEALLVKSSPTYMGDFSRITVNRVLWDAIGSLGNVVRTGKPSQTMVDNPDDAFWVEFSEASAKTSALPGAFLANKLDLADHPAEVLDVACGSGVYGFSVLQRYPKVHLTSLDWPKVLDQARREAERRGVADRVTWLGGSAFDAPLPEAHFDAIVVSHFYHHFPPLQNVALSQRLFAALKPGGVLAVHDWVADETRSQAGQALMFAVVMLVTTQRGDVYTFGEYREMLEAAGFTGLVAEDVPMVGSQVLLAQRPA